MITVHMGAYNSDHLYEGLVPDHGVECVEVRGEVEVQHEAISHLVQSLEAAGVARLVELLKHITHLRLQLKKLLEGAVRREGEGRRERKGGRERGREM